MNFEIFIALSLTVLSVNTALLAQLFFSFRREVKRQQAIGDFYRETNERVKQNTKELRALYVAMLKRLGG